MAVLEKRLPLEPLERVAFLEMDLPPHDGEHCGCRRGPKAGDVVDQCWSLKSFAHAVGQKSDKTIHRWREEGGLTHRAADKAATKLGLHPSMIWSEW